VGSATISNAGLVTVTGLTPEQSATVTVTTTRTGYAGGSATAQGAAPVPTLVTDPDEPFVNPGEAAYIFVDGTIEDAPLTLNATPPGSINAGNDEFQMNLQGNEDGAASVDEIKQTLIFYTGKEGLATGRGFLPGSEAEIWLFSTPRFLASTQVLEDGTFSRTFDVPPDIEVGEHVIQAEGLDTNSEPKAIAAGVIVTADEDGDLVADPEDTCPGTPPNEEVNAQGCSETQLNEDYDGDGVTNGEDQCADSPSGQPVNSAGCPQEVVPVPGLNALLTALLASLLAGVGLWVRRRIA